MFGGIHSWLAIQVNCPKIPFKAFSGSRIPLIKPGGREPIIGE
jgi:hypothetical protein